MVIPESVTEIGASAFENCTSLTGSITLDNVIEIRGAAFYDTKIEEVRIGKYIKSIGSSAFYRGLSEIPLYVYIKASNPPSFGNKILGDYRLVESGTVVGERIVYVPQEALDAYNEKWKSSNQAKGKIMGYDFENE